VRKVWSECVFENDNFNYVLGLEPKLTHEPDLTTEKSSQKIKFVYAVVKFTDGETQFVVLSRKEIEAIKNLGTSTNYLYFNDQKDPNHWMIKKAAIKQLAKTLSKDNYTKNALDIDSQVEGGSSIIMDLETKELLVVKKETKSNKPKSISELFG
jgi:recombinational DNA repair protein RecT